MTSFAQGTNPEYVSAYNNWFYGGGMKNGAPAPQSGASGPSTSPQPYAATSPQQAPSKSPDMSVYSQQAGQSGGAYSAYGQQPQYNANNVPRTPPKGAQQNNLSGNVPSNQIFAQAYNQVAGQYGTPGATSFTIPGSYTSQDYNPTTGQYGQMTGGQSFDGNMAYNAINNRPSPISASATGLDGRQMSFQDSLAQREAFAGNLSQRLGQYNSGQLTGPVTFDPSQLMSQANDQLANGTFANPFSQAAGPQRAPQATEQLANGMFANQASQQNPQVQQAMNNATQYMQGNFQNPFGNSPQANNPQPSWNQQSYDPNEAPPQQVAPAPAQRPGSAQPIVPQSQGTPYNPQAGAQSLPPVPPAPPAAAPPSYGEDPIAARKKAAKEQGQSDADLKSMRDRWLNGATTGQSYKQHLSGKDFKTSTPDQMADEYTGELWKRLNDGRLGQADYDKAVAGMDTDLNQSKSKQAKLQQMDAEINQWMRGTYGTGGDPSTARAGLAHIAALKQLRAKAAAGDPNALAWQPKTKAPPGRYGNTRPNGQPFAPTYRGV